MVLCMYYVNCSLFLVALTLMNFNHFLLKFYSLNEKKNNIRHTLFSIIIIVNNNSNFH